MGLALWLVACASTPRAAVAPDLGPASETMRIGPVDDSIVPPTLAFSDDGRHVAYLRGHPDGTELVVDGRSRGVYADAIQTIAWQPGADRVAWWVVGRGAYVLVVDGDEVLFADRSFIRNVGPPVWSVDGRLAVAGTATFPNGSVAQIWIDGDEVANLDEVELEPAWSPDGRRLAAAGKLDGEALVWLDGWTRRGYEEVVAGSLAWNDDGTVRFAARRASHPVIALGDREIEAAAPVTGPIRRAGEHLAYAIRAGGQQALVVDDRVVAAHDRIDALELFANGTTFALAMDGGRQRIYVGDSVFEPESLLTGSVWPRRDGACVAWLEEHGTGVWIVRRGVRGHAARCEDWIEGPFDSVGEPVWRPDGTIAFAAQSRHRAALHLGHIEIDLGALPPSFSWLDLVLAPDGRIAHLEESRGEIYRVLRAPGDLRPVGRM